MAVSTPGCNMSSGRAAIVYIQLTRRHSMAHRQWRVDAACSDLIAAEYEPYLLKTTLPVVTFNVKTASFQEPLKRIISTKNDLRTAHMTLCVSKLSCELCSLDCNIIFQTMAYTRLQSTDRISNQCFEF